LHQFRPGDPLCHGVEGLKRTKIHLFHLIPGGHHRRCLLLDQQRGTGLIQPRGLGQVIESAKQANNNTHDNPVPTPDQVDQQNLHFFLTGLTRDISLLRVIVFDIIGLAAKAV